MKPLSILLFLLLAAGTGAAAAGAVFFLWLAPASLEQGPRAAGPTPVAADPAADADEELARVQAEVRMLSSRVADLSQQLAMVRSSAERLPVAQVEPEAIQPVVAAVPRQQVETILTQLREEEQRQREQERAERERRMIEQRAERIARELGLAPADQTRLADFMGEANARRQELTAQVRENGFDREAMRASMQELRSWSNDELTRSFGAALAEQILDASGDFGGRGGWGAQGGRGRGERGGNNAGPTGSGL